MKLICCFLGFLPTVSPGSPFARRPPHPSRRPRGRPPKHGHKPAPPAPPQGSRRITVRPAVLPKDPPPADHGRDPHALRVPMSPPLRSAGGGQRVSPGSAPGHQGISRPSGFQELDPQTPD